MILQLAILSSMLFAQEPSSRSSTATEVTPPSFTIHRVEAQNRAIIATKEANTVKLGDEFTIETPYGACHLPVTQVITDYFYVDTQQCQSEFVRAGTTITSTRKIIIERIPSTVTETVIVGETLSEDSPEYMRSEFYQTYIRDRASVALSYYTGNALDGRIAYGANNTLEDLKGSNAIGLGGEYRIANLLYSLSSTAGFTYALPRSFGRYRAVTPAGAVNGTFANSPDLQMLSLYTNLRYQFHDTAYAVFGINHLFVNLNGLPGDMDGDFGFHIGAHVYPLQQMKQLFVVGNINFYNMDYQFQNTRAEFRLTELEVKAGYTF